MPLILYKQWLHGKNWKYIHETIEETNHNTCWFIHRKKSYSFTITNDENDILKIYFYIPNKYIFFKSSQIFMQIHNPKISECNNIDILHNISIYDIRIDSSNDVYIKDIHKKLIGEYLIKYIKK